MGVNSLLAFWVGGAGAAPAGQVGVHSMLAPWIGGAGAESTPATPSGVHGLLAYWIGGAGSVQTAPPPTGEFGGGAWTGSRRRVRVPESVLHDFRAQLIDEDEMLLALAAHIAAAGLLH